MFKCGKLNSRKAETVRFRIATYIGGDIAAVSDAFTITWGSAQWEDGTCTVTFESNAFDSGVSVIAACYDEHGRMVKMEYLTVEDPSAILTGDNVKVFFLDDASCSPIRKALEIWKP